MFAMHGEHAWMSAASGNVEVGADP